MQYGHLGTPETIIPQEEEQQLLSASDTEHDDDPHYSDSEPEVQHYDDDAYDLGSPAMSDYLPCSDEELGEGGCLPTYGDAYGAEWVDIQLDVIDEDPITIQSLGFVGVGDINLAAGGPRLRNCATCGDNVLIDSVENSATALPMFSPNWSSDGGLESHVIIKDNGTGFQSYRLIHFTDGVPVSNSVLPGDHHN